MTSPREKRRARTREAILDAAMQILTEKGVEALSIREIASRIDYSPSGLYEYFASKEEIIMELVNEGFVRLSRRMEHDIHGETAPLRLKQAARVYIQFALQEPQLYLLMFNHVPDCPTELNDLEQNIAYHKLLQILQDGVRSGAFRASSGAEELSFMSWAFIHGLAMLRLTLLNLTSEEVNVLYERSLDTFVAQLQS